MAAMYKPSELRAFLEGLGISPKKALSQNFLIDGNIIRKIVAEAGGNPGDVVLEIGPGPGSLTEALLEAGASVIAVEKDVKLAEALHRFQTDDSRLQVFCDDIMQFPVEEVLAKTLPQGRKGKLVANLPYNITTPIIAQFIPMRNQLDALVVMVQEEVARRFTAKPGTKDYSSFTLFLNFYSSPRYAFTVSNRCFFPEPSVQSAVVVLDLKEPPHVSDVDAFFMMTRTAFEHRRKMLRGSLKSLYDPAAVTQALAAINKPAETRPEELSLEEFIALFECLSLA